MSSKNWLVGGVLVCSMSWTQIGLADEWHWEEPHPEYTDKVSVYEYQLPEEEFPWWMVGATDMAQAYSEPETHTVRLSLACSASCSDPSDPSCACRPSLPTDFGITNVETGSSCNEAQGCEAQEGSGSTAPAPAPVSRVYADFTCTDAQTDGACQSAAQENFAVEMKLPRSCKQLEDWQEVVQQGRGPGINVEAEVTGGISSNRMSMSEMTMTNQTLIGEFKLQATLKITQRKREYALKRSNFTHRWVSADGVTPVAFTPEQIATMNNPHVPRVRTLKYVRVSAGVVALAKEFNEFVDKCFAIPKPPGS